MNRYGIPKEDSKELKNNVDNSSSGGSKMEYYKLNLDKYASMGNDAPFGGIFYVAQAYPCLLRVKNENVKAIGAYSFLKGNTIVNVEQFIEAGFDMIAFDPNIKIIIDVLGGGLQVNTENVWDFIKHWISLGVSHADDALIPITEEEFYNLN